jgi:ketosteroid isomerase-like protein
VRFVVATASTIAAGLQAVDRSGTSLKKNDRLTKQTNVLFMNALALPNPQGAFMSAASAIHAAATPVAVRHPIDPRIDPRAWVINNERITNQADRAGWLALYAPDAVYEAITDGAYDRLEGLPAIARGVGALIGVLAEHRLRVQKRFVSATHDTVVNTWSGGFAGRTRQFGMEIWTLRDALVVRHEQYTFLEVRPSEDIRSRVRALFGGELRVKLAVARARAVLR